jgi:hypothetical protein
MATCAFCGETGNPSSEHVIPRWLSGPLTRAQLHPQVDVAAEMVTHRFERPVDSGTESREWRSRGLGLLTNRVCKTCNSGWLSNLESDAGPIVAPLVTGQAASLDGHHQTLLATWSYKTLLLCQMLRPPSIRSIPASRLRQFFTDRRPPDDAHLWIGVTQGGTAVHESSTHVDFKTVGDNATPGYFSFLAIGNMLILCAGRQVEHDRPFHIDSRADPSSLIRLWPASIRPVAWPRTTPIENLEVTYLAGLV